jgi:hypothetical protein
MVVIRSEPHAGHVLFSCNGVRFTASALCGNNIALCLSSSLICGRSYRAVSLFYLGGSDWSVVFFGVGREKAYSTGLLAEYAWSK